MTDRTWYLYWIAVAKEAQSLGLGAAMLRVAEGTSAVGTADSS